MIFAERCASLLSVNGIGSETADSILLYAGESLFLCWMPIPKGSRTDMA
jgi:endonuclease III-like uncharacterized protein